jgi:hypothetical protein
MMVDTYALQHPTVLRLGQMFAAHCSGPCGA